MILVTRKAELTGVGGKVGATGTGVGKGVGPGVGFAVAGASVGAGVAGFNKKRRIPSVSAEYLAKII